MDIDYKLELDTNQDIYMTPELQQSIELLQFSSQDLHNYIQEEFEKNPFLVEEQDIESEEKEIELNQEYEYFQSNNENYNYNQEINYENFVGEKISLRKHLEQQLHQVLDTKEKKIGKYIIGNLDNNGFLDLSYSEISEKFNISLKKVKNIINKIQYLDPVGIAAQNLRDALLIQLDSISLNTELAEKIIKENFQDLENKNFKHIFNAIPVSKERIQGAINLIKTLNPYPASGFNDREKTKYIEPDILIKKNKDNYIVVMNQNTNPYLRINSYYYKLLKKSEKGELSEYLADKYKSAIWLIKSIEKRRITMYKIAKAIVKKQRKFLEKALKFVEPMTMKEIAEEINMHESTVSRATSEKYIQTPQGLFELKYFFSSKINNVSAISLKTLIKEIVENEDVTNPLSDKAISKKLKKIKGVNISRRTVAKYRNQLGILASNKRKARY